MNGSPGFAERGTAMSITAQLARHAITSSEVHTVEFVLSQDES